MYASDEIPTWVGTDQRRDVLDVGNHVVHTGDAVAVRIEHPPDRRDADHPAGGGDCQQFLVVLGARVRGECLGVCVVREDASRRDKAPESALMP